SARRPSPSGCQKTSETSATVRRPPARAVTTQAQSWRYHAAGDHRVGLSLAQELADQGLEVVDPVLAARRKAPGVVGAGAQAALDLLADDDVLLLDLVAEGDRLLHRL